MAFKKMTADELLRKFIDLDMAKCYKVTGMKKIGARAIRIDTEETMTGKKRPLYFMWYNEDNWTIGTKLYRNRPKAKEKKEPNLALVEMSDLSVPRDDDIMGRYLNLYDILAIQMDDVNQVTSIIKRVWEVIDYYGEVDLQCLKEILDLNPVFTDTYYFWDNKNAFEAKLFERKYYLMIHAPKHKDTNNE